MRRPAHGSKARRGIAAPAVAVSVIVLVAVLAVAMDGGLLMGERRRGQAAADAAALAAACSLYRQDQLRTDHSLDGLDTDGSALASARTTSASNAYPYNGPQTAVTVNVPPRSGAFAGKPHYAEVLVKFNNARGFSRIWGADPVPTTARAVARGLWSPYTQAGIIILNPTVPKALKVTGDGDVTVKSGAIIVDSSDSQAAFVSGGGSVLAAEVDITGTNPGYRTAGGGGLTTDPPGRVYTDKPPTPDPLAGVPPPDPNTLPTRSWSRLKVNQGTTLQPGRYIGGVSISGGAVTMQPGVYYMDHGGFMMTNGTLTGDGVMIYNDPDPNGSDKIQVTGGTWNLTAPATGPYTGMVLWQSRAADNVPIHLTGQASCNMIGTVYAPSSPVQVSGWGDATIGSMFISDTLTVTGSGSFTVDWKGRPAPGKRDIRLVE